MPLLTLLRPATEQDCAAIHNVHLHAVQYTCIHSYNEQALQAWEALLDNQSYLEAMSDSNKALWVLEYRNIIQGFFQIDFKEAQLDALYVHPLLHNRGLGTALLQKAEDLARHAGLYFLKLYASLNSLPFYHINRYESLGEAVLPLNKTIKIKCELLRKYL
ncbi:GNAT family N-acetyltransferase [Neisseria sp. ZJ106]|uniref:GNAT family N-acetyltransferase n=1 Tax=Neisseria lisongii TaxID=2912188 RepID=A0ABY7RLN3_9NEIS|nr:GNAT family N-acetyltransferase [Neisseria lisongii]MCF7521334.1 GNAT family N-acetyltransferase [Neisseria lisongii]WCL72138.1 GNAT family N-acetyltransferase [Neisseria lisongii]